MPAVHEHVHQRAGEKEQPRKKRQHVRTVLREKEEGGHEGEADEYPSGAGAPSHIVRAVAMETILHDPLL
jgi:hypothetical protein